MIMNVTFDSKIIDFLFVVPLWIKKGGFFVVLERSCWNGMDKRNLIHDLLGGLSNFYVSKAFWLVCLGIHRCFAWYFLGLFLLRSCWGSLLKYKVEKHRNLLCAQSYNFFLMLEGILMLWRICACWKGQDWMFSGDLSYGWFL